jgi:hypothetical protein
MKSFSIACAILFVAGCSAHNPMIISNTTTSTPVEVRSAPISGKVFVSEQSLPPSVSYRVLSTIEVGKIWYGSSKDVLVSMADRARELGANAVVDVKTWHQPSGFSWAAPHGSGQAVHIDDVHQLEVLQPQGSWY